MSLECVTFIVTLAAASHLYFNRHEPSVESYLGITFLGWISILLSFMNHRAFSFTSSFLHATFLASIYHTSLAISILIYRNSHLHPLFGYPGPIIARCTKLYEVYYQIKGTWYLKVQEFHEIYGDIVRVGPNELSFAAAESVASIYKSRLPKSQSYQAADAMRSIITTRDPDEHSVVRKQWSPGFTPNAIKDYEPLITRRVNQLLQKLTNGESLIKGTNESLDLRQFIRDYALFVTSDLAGYSEFHNTREDILFRFWENLKTALFVSACMRPIPHIRPILDAIVTNLTSAQKEAFDASLKLLKMRFESPDMRRDILFHVLGDNMAEALSPHKYLQTITSAFLVLGAGTDTISTAMTTFFYFILKHPTNFKRIQAEVDALHPTGDTEVLSTAMLSFTPFLDACINETLRLEPPQRVGSPRNVIRGTAICGQVLPAGTVVSTSVWTLQRDKRVWGEDASEFRPERWFGPNVPKHAYLPFSEGKANCIGKGLALVEMKMAITSIVGNFDIVLDEKSHDFTANIPEHTVTVIPPLYVRIYKRQN